MSVRVKICGIRTSHALRAALAHGADFIGLVFYPPSPRHVSLRQAARLAEEARGRAAIVALLVDAGDELIQAVTRTVKPDFLQLHGNETPQRVRAIAAFTQLPLIKAFRLRRRTDLRQVAPYAQDIAFALFDAWHDTRAALPGGMGQAFDWSWLRDYSEPFMLAGGLTPENVGEAIRVSAAPMVDVSSGVEKRRGEKDAQRIAQFIHKAKAARPAPE